MSDEDNAGPFSNMSLGQLFMASQKAHDRQHMHAEALMVAVYGMVENLSNADLFTLRRVLMMEKESASMNFFDGIVVGYMRWQRGLNPDTGRTLEEAAADAAAADAARGN